MVDNPSLQPEKNEKGLSRTPSIILPNKTRIRWSQDLHEKFVESVNRLGGAESKYTDDLMSYRKSDLFVGSIFSNEYVGSELANCRGNSKGYFEADEFKRFDDLSCQEPFAGIDT